MALAVVGVRVKVEGVTQAINQFRQVRREIDRLVASARRLRSLNVGQGMNIVNAAPGSQVAIDQSVNRNMREGAAAARGLGNEAERNIGIFRRFQGHINIAGQGIRRFGRIITTFGSVLTTLGFRMSAIISLPIIGALIGAVKAATTFETELTKLITLVGISAQDVDMLKDAFLELAPALGVSPIDLATAAYQPLSRELRDIGSVIAIVTKAAKGQAIGLGDMNKIAQVATSIMIAFGKASASTVKQLGAVDEIMDKLIVAIQRGSLEADEFVGPLARVLGTASNLGVELDEILAFAGTFGAAGASASEVFTGLNRVLLTFLKPTEKAKDALDRLFNTVQTGIPGIDAALTMLGEEGLARTIIAIARGAEELDIPMSDLIGRVTGLNAALFVTGNAMELYLTTLGFVKGANGELEESFKIVAESGAFQMQQLKASLEVLAITIGDVIVPALNFFVQKLLPVIGAITIFAKMHPRIVLLAVGFGLVTAAIGPIIIIIGVLVSSIGAIITGIGALIGALAVIIGPVQLVIAVFLLLSATLAGLFLVSLPEIFKRTQGNFEKMIDNFFAWGRNMMVQLANGLAKGAEAVITVLIEVGRAIAGLLGPGSPPKLLPDLPMWGANIIEQLLKGMTLADFGTFDKIASIMSDFFRGLGEDIFGEDETGLIPAILTSRQNILKALEEARTTGSISQGTLDSITMFTDDSFQPHLVGRIQDYIRTLVDLQIALDAVAEAQAEIDRINTVFEANVAPLNDRLGEIADRYQEVKDAQERARLEAILVDPRAPALALELAELGLEELDLQQQVRAEEALRDEALAAANAQLTAAEAERDRLQDISDLQLENIQFYLDTNDLLREQSDLIERINERKKKAAEELASSLANIGDLMPAGAGVGTGLDLTELIGEGFQAHLKSIQKNINDFVREIGTIFEGLGPLIERLGVVWGKVFIKLGDRFKVFQGRVAGLNLETADWVGIGFIAAGVMSLLIALLKGGGLIGLVLSLAGWVARAVAALVGFIALGNPLSLLLLGAIILVGALFARFESLKEFTAAAAVAIGQTAIILRTIFSSAVGWAKIILKQLGTIIKTKVTKQVELFKTEMEETVLELKGSWTTAINSFKDNVLEPLAKAWDGITTAIGWVIQRVQDLIDKLKELDLGDLMGNSPSPFELSLRGIASALNKVNSELQSTATMGAMASASAATVSTSVKFGDIHVNNGMDQAAFEARVRQIIAQAMR